MLIKTTFLIIALTYANAVSLRTTAEASQTNMALKVAKIFKDGEGPTKVAKDCLAGVMANVETPFCWKKEGPLGVDPKCPANFEVTWHSLKTLCVEICGGDYITVATECI